MKLNSILLAMLEVSEGVDPGVDGTHVMETVDGISVTQYDGEKVTRNVDSVIPSVGPEINKSPHSTWSFNIDASGSGTKGTAPAFGCLLQACGFVETVDTATPGSETVTYELSHNKSKTVTLVRHTGGKMIQKTHGVRGELSIDFNQFIRMQFGNCKGSYVRPAAGGNPVTIAYSNYADPLPVNKENTVTVDLGGQALKMTGGSINFGGGASYRNIPNSESSAHGDFEPTGQLTFVAPDIATKNYFADAESHNGVVEQTFQLVHGTVGGNIIEIVSARVQLSNISETDIDGDVGFQADIRFLEAPKLIFK
jgi:hypothetical protein